MEELQRLQNTTNTLLKSIEQLKDGSTPRLLTPDQSAEVPATLRTSLSRKVKDFKNDKTQNVKKVQKNSQSPHSNSICPCGNVAENQCKTKNCVNCCKNPSCEAKNHKKKKKGLHTRQSNAKKSKLTPVFVSDDSSDSSDEDLPLVSLKKKLTVEERSKEVSEASSDSTDEDLPLVNMKRKRLTNEQNDEDCTPHHSKQSKEMKRNKGIPGDSSKLCHQSVPVQPALPVPQTSRIRVQPALRAPQTSSVPSPLQIPTLTPHVIIADSSQPTATTLRLPLSLSPVEQSPHHFLPTPHHVLPKPLLNPTLRIPPLSVILPTFNSQQTANSSKSCHQRVPLQPCVPETPNSPSLLRIPTLLNAHMIAGSSRPNMPLLTRLPFLSSPLEQFSTLRIPPPSGLLPPDYHQIADPSGANITVHNKPEPTQQPQGNCDKHSIDLSKEDEEANIRRFYVRCPSTQCFKQNKIVEIFKPYCGLRHIEWIDKRSAYVTINEDATFQSYDGIFLNLVMKSDKENDNIIYVSPYSEIMKKHSVENINKKTEKK